MSWGFRWATNWRAFWSRPCAVAHRPVSRVPTRRRPELGGGRHLRVGDDLTASSFTSIWVWLAHAGDLSHPELRARIPAATRRSLVGPAVYLVGTVLAVAAFAVFAFAALFVAFSGRTATVAANPDTPA